MKTGSVIVCLVESGHMVSWVPGGARSADSSGLSLDGWSYSPFLSLLSLSLVLLLPNSRHFRDFLISHLAPSGGKITPNSLLLDGLGCLGCRLLLSLTLRSGSLLLCFLLSHSVLHSVFHHSSECVFFFSFFFWLVGRWRNRWWL